MIAANIIEEVIQQHRIRKEESIGKEWGIDFVIHRDVFCPFLAPSGSIGFAFASLPIFKEKKILDIGCGSGIIAALMAINGAKKVVGIDINPSAIQNAQKNAKAIGFKDQLEFRVGDCLSEVDSKEEFDIIYADLPFTDGQPKDILESAFYDPGLSSIRKLISEFSKHPALTNATLYLVTSNLAGQDLQKNAKIIGLSWSHFFELHLPWIQISVSTLVMK